MGLGNCFKGRRFTAEVILWAVRWYLMFPVSYRDLELMLLDRGVEVDHTTIFRWIQAYATELEKRIRPHLRMSNGSWRVDETYIRVKGRWTYLYRAVDSRGQDDRFPSSSRGGIRPRRSGSFARPSRSGTSSARALSPSTRILPPQSGGRYEKRRSAMKRRTRLRQCKYLNNIVEQDHRRIKRFVRPGSASAVSRTARQTLAGFETMAMMRKGQVRKIDGHDIRAAAFIADLFDRPA